MSDTHLQPDYAGDPNDMLLIVDNDTHASLLIAKALIEKLTRERDAYRVALMAYANHENWLQHKGKGSHVWMPDDYNGWDTAQNVIAKWWHQ